jgi:hypothetical protein
VLASLNLWAEHRIVDAWRAAPQAGAMETYLALIQAAEFYPLDRSIRFAPEIFRHEVNRRAMEAR